MKYLAHSAEGNIPEQPYEKHITEVQEQVLRNAQSLLHYYNGDAEQFRHAVSIAAEWHDLGKLSSVNQAVLQGKVKRKSLPINHVDAGTAFLKDRQNIFAAVLVYGHHIGLFSRCEEINKKQLFLRDLKEPTLQDTNTHLDEYVKIHSICLNKKIATSSYNLTKELGFSLRIALSCLVDADHYDTARHYKKHVQIPEVKLRWEERLAALDAHIENLNKESDDTPRNRLRQEIYNYCRNGKIHESLTACDAPVGSGKTTAVMAYLLKTAIQKKLRHIFVVLPYTNIINQSVKKYREILTFPGEHPEEIVAAHHHQVEFESDELRALTTLWKAPIIVTTAVQFFETIAAHKTARLKKIHELPGSAIFVDEAHAAMPAWMWSQHWLWMNELAQRWGCHYVLASGSLSRFWELSEFVGNDKKTIPDLVPLEIRDNANEFERKRIRKKKIATPLNRKTFLELIKHEPGPHLIIMNTVQSAAVLADYFRKAGRDVEHLSTALAPVHRDPIIKRITKRLANKQQDHDWTLVATSCVEAGLDWSFQTVFRESSSVTSLYQSSGRGNRENEEGDATIYSFRTLDPLLNHHPAFDASSEILDDFLENGLLEKLAPADCVTLAMKREVSRGEGRKKAEKLKKAEQGQEYPKVSELSRIINTDTYLVVVNSTVVEMLMDRVQRKKVTSRTLVNNSVQVWTNKIPLLGVKPFPFSDELFYLDDSQYDPEFLGYMKAMLSVLEMNETGCMIL
ncbi:MAG: CRISPR-associated endonuclease Cas3'' [Deltaproteobacteria bacterium]|nr:CRISPR-associated endonuclease Cas3'' [Deltaproteobacteria bacterium]